MTINAKCKLLMICFFVVWHVNENFETKLAYFDKYLSMERLNKTKYVLGIVTTQNVVPWGLSAPAPGLHVLNHEKKMYKIRLQRDFF